jgi:hypothetical protein
MTDAAFDNPNYHGNTSSNGKILIPLTPDIYRHLQLRTGIAKPTNPVDQNDY